MDLKNHFGVNVEKMFVSWFHGEFAAEFKKRFPDAEGITLVVFYPMALGRILAAWDNPLSLSRITCVIGDVEASTAMDGTLNNVEGKMRFVLRNLCNSLESEEELIYLLQPGDFPWEGAGDHRSIIGGVSGLDKKDDWAVFCECADKLIEMLTSVAQAAIERSNQLRHDQTLTLDQRSAAKYLYDINVGDLFPDYATMDWGGEPSPLN